MKREMTDREKLLASCLSHVLNAKAEVEAMSVPGGVISVLHHREMIERLDSWAKTLSAELQPFLSGAGEDRGE